MAVTTVAPAHIIDFEFDPALFVNREKEKKLFIETVEAKSKHIYLEFNGVAGQGKSELLKWVFHNAEEHGYLAAYVDFERREYHRPEIYFILKTITEHLSLKFKHNAFPSFHEKLPLCLEYLRKFYQETLDHPQSADIKPLKRLEEDLITAFNQEFQTLLRNYKIVLCLDSTEKAYLTALRSFEKDILAQYAQEHNFWLVTAGQEKLVWKTREIKDLVKPRNLERLDQKSVQEQIARIAEKENLVLQDTEQICDTIFQITNGHPFSNYRLIHFWTKESDQNILDSEKVDNDLGKGIKNLIDTIIEDRVLENLELGNEYPPAREILWYLAPLRRIEFGALWYMLSTFLDKWFKDKPFEFFERLMEKFQKKRIFLPWSLGLGHDLEPVVRNILLWDIRVNARKEQFIEIERRLAEQYDKWVGQSRDATQIKNIVERFYHYALYLNEISPQDINILIEKELKNYLEKYFSSGNIVDETIALQEKQVASKEQLERLFKAIETDKELKKLVNLPELLLIISAFSKRG